MAADRTHAHLSRRILLALVLSLAAAGTVQAETSSPTAAGNAATSAKAVLGFRIVIRESLGLGTQSKGQSIAAPQMTRSTSIESGRRLVTLAQP